MGPVVLVVSAVISEAASASAVPGVASEEAEVLAVVLAVV